jgi:hypothetical protein
MVVSGGIAVRAVVQFSISLAALAVCTAPAFQSHAAAQACASRYRFQPRTTLSLNAVSRLSTEPYVFNNTTGSIVVQNFSNEDAPFWDGYTAQALIHVSTGDLGDHAVGGILWSKDRVRVDEAGSAALNRKNEDVVQALITVPASKGCAAETLKFRFDRKLAFSLGNRLLGRVTPVK